MDIPAEYFGLIEGGISLVAVLAFAGWQLWTLREKPGPENQNKTDEAEGRPVFAQDFVGRVSMRKKGQNDDSGER